MRKRVKAIIILIPVIVAVALLVLFMPKRKDNAAEAVAFETAPAQMRTYKRIIDISGYVEPFDEVELRFRSSGAVTAVYVKEGD